MEALIGRIAAWFRNLQQRRREALAFERRWVVEHDDLGVRVSRPDGEQRAIGWSDLWTVAIETNDSGPWGSDVWWVFEGASARVGYPQGATGDAGMLEVMQARLAGFRDAMVIEAMGCTDNARFVCWTREVPEAGGRI